MGPAIDAIVLAQGAGHAVRDALRGLGFLSVIELRSEAEALDLALETRPRMLVAEHDPPDRDGIRFLGLTRLAHPTACRVLVVDEMRFDLVEDARARAAVHGFLQHPVQADGCRPVLASALDLARRDAGHGER